MKLLTEFEEVQEQFSELSSLENSLEELLTDSLKNNREINFEKILNDFNGLALDNMFEELHCAEWLSLPNENAIKNQQSYSLTETGAVCLYCKKPLKKVSSKGDGENVKWGIEQCDCEKSIIERRIIMDFEAEQKKLKDQLNVLYKDTDEKLTELKQVYLRTEVNYQINNVLRKIFRAFITLSEHSNQVLLYLSRINGINLEKLLPELVAGEPEPEIKLPEPKPVKNKTKLKSRKEKKNG
jgi:hypothetical protein